MDCLQNLYDLVQQRSDIFFIVAFELFILGNYISQKDRLPLRFATYLPNSRTSNSSRKHNKWRDWKDAFDNMVG